jgi:hypothetical protein
MGLRDHHHFASNVIELQGRFREGRSKDLLRLVASTASHALDVPGGGSAMG